jgi:hypothetical protein
LPLVSKPLCIYIYIRGYADLDISRMLPQSTLWSYVLESNKEWNIECTVVDINWGCYRG